jgi:FkbM family methyltransferase
MNFSIRKAPSLGLALKKMFMYLPKMEFIIKNSQGVWAVAPFNDGITISSDYFEEGLRLWPGRSVNKRIFIDIGANIGKYTIVASNIFNFSHILSIEANPITVKFLRKNLSLNNLEQKTSVVEVAVGNRIGEVTIQSDVHHLGGANVVDDNNQKSTHDISCCVKMVTVDSILLDKKIDPREVDFIKIDIERMEKSALEGMTMVLLGMPIKSLIMIEITQDKREVLEILSRYGFVQVENIADDYLFIKN